MNILTMYTFNAVEIDGLKWAIFDESETHYHLVRCEPQGPLSPRYVCRVASILKSTSAVFVCDGLSRPF